MRPHVRRIVRPALPIVTLALAACASAGGGETTDLTRTTTATTTTSVAGSGGTVASIATDTREVQSTLGVPISADRAWTLLPLVYADLGIEVATMRQNERAVGNPSFRTRRSIGGVRASRYLECGSASGGPNADTYSLTLDVITQVRAAPSGDSTYLDTRLGAQAQNPTYGGSVVTCSSTGGLERRIAEQLLTLHRRAP